MNLPWMLPHLLRHTFVATMRYDRARKNLDRHPGADATEHPTRLDGAICGLLVVDDMSS